MNDSPPRTAITFLGHSTVLIELDGRRLLTDPVLRERVGPLRRHGPRVDAVHHGDLDAVLISHLHWDHLHLPSLRVLPSETLLVVPRGAGRALRRRGFPRVEEMDPGDELRLPPLGIRATAAAHVVRAPMAPLADSLGFLINGSRRIYFAGDTDLFEGMAELAGVTGGIDLALLPVWGWGPRVGRGHLDPARAAAALQLLRPRMAVPVHWGALYPLGLPWRRPHALMHAPELFREHAAELAPDVKVCIVPPGGSLALA